jgi:uncharacterized protein
MIIDSHVHIFPREIQSERERLCAKDLAFGSVYSDPKARMACAEDVIGALDAVGAQGAVVFGFPWGDAAICRDHNDYVAEASRVWGGRFVGMGCVSPASGEVGLLEAERCLDNGLQGIGEIAAYGDEGVELQSPFFNELAGLLERSKRPLLLHATESVGHAYCGKDRTDLEALYNYILVHPGVDIILAHWGGGLFFYELMPEVHKACGRVYYDTSASPFLYRADIYRVALQIVGQKRVLLGSDFPLIHPRRYIREIRSQGLVQGDLQGILGGNAARLWEWDSGLPPQEE